MTMNKTKVSFPPHVVMSSDAAYVDGLAGTLSAVARRVKGRELTVTVLDSGLGEELWGRLTEVFARRHPWLVLQRVKLEPESLARFSSPAAKRLGLATYARLLLPELLPDVSRVVYMDCDIYTDTDLTPLFELDLRGAWAAAVRDMGKPFLVSHLPEGVLPEGADPAVAPAFNAGFIVIDLDAWRRVGLMELAAECAGRVQGRFQDQAILNYTLHGRWLSLPERWNRHFFVTENFSVYRDWPDSVWHFERKGKAWHYPSGEARGVFREFQEEWSDCGWTRTSEGQVRQKSPAARDRVKAARAVVLRTARRVRGVEAA